MADKKINGSLEITGNINNTSPLYVSQRAGYTTTPDFSIFQFKGIDNRGNGYWGYLKEHILTQDRTWHLPEASGTIALTSDIPSVALNTTLNTESITVGNDTLKVMTTNTDQIISGTKTFNSYPSIPGISNSENNNTIASFNYDSTEGSSVASTGHFTAYGDDDSSNTFSNHCSNNTLGENYIHLNELKTGVSYINLTSASPATATNSNWLQNIIINTGVKGKGQNNNRTITVERNLSHSTTILAPGSREIILDEE